MHQGVTPASRIYRKLRPWIALFLIVMTGAGLIWLADRLIPNEHLPWKPLDPSRPLGLATKGQLLRLSVSPSDVCMNLARTIDGFESIPADPREAKDPCGWEVARLVYSKDQMQLQPGEASMQCPLSVASYLWMRELDTLSQSHYDQPLSAVHHMGTYSCRRQRGNGSGRWSEHAFANAWDIGAFELEDGTLIRLITGWNGDDETDRQFLRDARDAACKIFNVTLSPDYNAAHRDHFHVDMGPYSSCR